MAVKKRAVVKKKAVKKTAGKPVLKHSHELISALNPAFHAAMIAAGPAAPRGSCRWSDANGGFHCADNVTKDACDNLGGRFTAGGQC